MQKLIEIEIIDKLTCSGYNGYGYYDPLSQLNGPALEGTAGGDPLKTQNVRRAIRVHELVFRKRVNNSRAHSDAHHVHRRASPVPGRKKRKEMVSRMWLPDNRSFWFRSLRRRYSFYFPVWVARNADK